MYKNNECGQEQISHPLVSRVPEKMKGTSCSQVAIEFLNTNAVIAECQKKKPNFALDSQVIFLKLPTICFPRTVYKKQPTQAL
jgi:hypothetical protein